MGLELFLLQRILVVFVMWDINCFRFEFCRLSKLPLLYKSWLLPPWDFDCHHFMKHFGYICWVRPGGFHYIESGSPLRRKFWLVRLLWDLNCLSYVGPLSFSNYFYYAGLLVTSATLDLLPQLVTFTTWDFCYLNWSVPLCRTYSLRYIYLFQTGAVLGHVSTWLSDRSSFRVRT